MDKKKFKTITKSVFKEYGYHSIGKYIYKDYGIFIIKIEPYKSNYSDDYYIHAYINIKRTGETIIEILKRFDMIIGIRLQNKSKKIYSFDYSMLKENEYYNTLHQLVNDFDKTISESPIEFLKTIDTRKFKKDIQDEIHDLLLENVKDRSSN